MKFFASPKLKTKRAFLRFEDPTPRAVGETFTLRARSVDLFRGRRLTSGRYDAIVESIWNVGTNFYQAHVSIDAGTSLYRAHMSLWLPRVKDAGRDGLMPARHFNSYRDDEWLFDTLEKNGVMEIKFTTNEALPYGISFNFGGETGGWREEGEPIDLTARGA